MVEECGYFVNWSYGGYLYESKAAWSERYHRKPIFKSDMQNGTTYSLDGSQMNIPEQWSI